MSQKQLSLAIRAMMILFAGLVFGLLAATGGGTGLGAKAASATPSACSLSGNTATITLNGTTVTLTVKTVSSDQHLFFASGTTAATDCGDLTTTITSIKFTTGSETAQTIVLDMNSGGGGAIPCTTSFTTDAVGSGTPTNALVDIIAANAENVTVGSDGINLAGCGSPQGNPGGVGAWKLETKGASVLSAKGSSGTSPVSQPVTFVAGPGNDTFQSSTTGSALDFSQIACATGPCSLTVNTTGSTYASTVNPSTSVYTDTGAAISYTYDFTSTASNFTSFTGLAGGSTTFAATGVGGYTFVGNGSSNSVDFSAAASGVTVDMHAGPGTAGSPAPVTVPAGTDSISGITAVTGSTAGSNSFTAGPGPASYTFTAAGTGNTFTGGAGVDVFNATGNGNTFKVGTGNATINAASTTGNTVDFSRLTGTSTVDVSGDGNNDTATSGASTYTFTTFGSTPATLKGSQGGTTFLAGPTAGYTFVGNGGLGTADFSAAGAAIIVDLSGGSSGTVTLAGGVDDLSGLTTVIGFTGGGNTFTAGPGPAGFAFTSTGNGNTFIGGAGPDTFTTTGTSNNNTFKVGTGSATISASVGSTGNTVDFSALTGQLLLNVSGSTVALTPPLANDTATSGSSTYTFTSFGTTPAVFKGSSGGTTFYAGANGGYTFVGSGGTNTADFSADSNSITANLSSSSTQTPVTNPIPGITVGSNQVLVAHPGGSQTTCIASPVPSFCDNLSGITQVFGSSVGQNTFVAGATSENFGDRGTTGGDSIDFSNVPTGGGTSLTINVSGTPFNGNLNLATAGAAVYNILAGTTDFTTFTGSGSANGSTTFVAGSVGGYTFIGKAGSNSAVFVGGTGVVVNLSGGSVTTNAQIGPSITLSNFTLGVNQVLVTNPSGSVCTQLACDTLTNITTVTGPTSGYSTFYAGPGPAAYNFSDAGDHNTFFGGSGTDTFTGGGNFNTFVAGSGSATFNETAPSATATGNVIDFSNVPVGSTPGCALSPCTLLINVSGSPALAGNFGAVIINSANAVVSTYSFATGGQDFSTFKGATGGSTTFLGGLGTYTYIGQGPGNTLDFSRFVPSAGGTLTFDVTHTPSPQATLQGVPETFSGITNLVGLSTGNTTFVAGSAGGYSFTGNGSNNVANFSAQGPSTTLTVTITSSAPITGGTVTFSLAGGTVLCSSVPVLVSGGVGTASCSTSSLPAGTDQVVAVYTPPSGAAFSGSGFVLSVPEGGTAPVPTTFISGLPTVGSLSGHTSSDVVSLSGTVNVNSASTPIAPGTLTFSIAGGPTLCSVAVPGGSVNAETVSCNASFPAGTFDVIATYTPSDSTVSGSAALLHGVNITSPVVQSSTSVGLSCDAFGDCTATANISIPSGTLPGGTVNFTFAGGGVLCSGVAVSPSGSTGTASCAFFAFDSEYVVAVYTPSASSPPVSPSAGISGATTCFFCFSIPTSTALSAAPTGAGTPPTVIEGTSITFTATVTSSSALPGGTVTFSVAGGTTLCVVQVPSGVTSATLKCVASLPTAGYDDVIAVYTPSGFGFTGSAADQPLQIVPPAASTSSVAATLDTQSGVTVNLSSSSATGTVATGPSTTTSVTISSGQVLVAAPPTGVSACGSAPLPSFCDSLSGITTIIGSSGGSNTFVAGSSSEVFGDLGTVGGDAIDFSRVPTGSSPSTLTVNVTSGSGSFTASVAGGGPTYNFSTTNGSDFTIFTGSAQGFTTFLAGSTPGYSFTATGPGNVIDFSASKSSVIVNLSGVTQLGVAPNNVGVGVGTDAISGLSTVIGSNAGGNTFFGGSIFPSYTFTASGTGNTFVAGLSPDTFNDPAAGNTVDFSQLAGLSVVVDRSSTTVSPTLPNNATASNGSNYSFGSAATTFVGAPAGSTFYAGTATDTFNGFSGAVNRLIFQFAPQSSLTVCVISFGTCVGGQAQVSGVPQVFFSNIGSFTGLAAGNTTFFSGDTGGFTFTGLGSANTADFSGALHPVNVNLATPTNTVAVFSGPADTISGITTIFGSCRGGNTFIAGTTSETFGDIGNTGVAPCNVAPAADGINFSALTGTTPSSLLTINASGKQDVLSPYTATFGTATWTFSSGGSNFLNFTGATSGNTVFLGSGTATGFTFIGSGTNNTLNLATNTSGVTVDMTTGKACLGLPTCLTGLPGTQDTFSDITAVIGSPTGANTFFGGLTGTSFTAQSTNNTLSYLESAGPVNVDLTTGTVSGPGTADTFSFPSGTLKIQGSPGNDTFVVGSRAVTLQGGGGADALDLSHLTNGLQVNLSVGSVTGSGTGAITFTPCTASPTSTQLCLDAVTGTPGSDTFTAAAQSLDAGLPVLNIGGGGGVDTLDLSQVGQSATINMATGTVTGGTSHLTGVTFTGITTLIGTGPGADTVIAGTGTANLFETGCTTTNIAPCGTLDFSATGAPVGVSVTVTTTSGTPAGTATNSLNSLNYTFNGFMTTFGTSLADTFTQNGPGSFNFNGLGGNNTLALNNLPSNVVVSLSPGIGCDSGNSDGTAVLSGQVNDQFTCMFQVSSGGSLIFVVTPGENTSVNGGGNGTLELAGSPSGGATINLGTGEVTGGGYHFSFTGMSTIDGTTFNDVFIAGPGSFTLNGIAGSDTISFVGAPSAVVINDSSTSYTVPSGYANSGVLVPAHSTLGGYGGVIKLIGIYNLVASASNADILVADNSNYGALTGGAGNDRFVLTGADDYLYAGTGGATLDLSFLPGQTSLDLAMSSLQPLGTGDGFVTLGGGNITTVVASLGGSQIWGGTGTVNLVGGPGSDWLAAGSGTQTLTGGGGSDTLVGGVGTDTLQGGSSPVTFVPGQGTETLTSPTTGNTLSYAGAPSAVQVNLANQAFVQQGVAPLTATGGWNATVNLAGAGVSNVIGTGFADIFVTGSNDTIYGNGGSDLFVVNGGNNVLTAGTNSGSRFFFDQLQGYTEGNNIIYGGGNGTVDFSSALSGVNVNLQTGNASGGWAGAFQKISGVLNIIGSMFSDTLVAGGPGGTIIGLDGNDFLIAGPSGGDTLESGGSGRDTFCAQSSCASGNATGGGNIMIGGTGDDVFFAVNGVPDIINGGAGFNSAFTDPTEYSVTNIQQQTVG